MNTILSYLSDLEQHNEREWYHAHKAQYQEAHTAFIDLLSQLIWEIGKTDSSIIHNNPQDLTFKLVRDTRFSQDKSPYNPTFRAHISSKGKLPIPVGYYIKIQPGNRSFLGGGLFADMFKDATSMVRDYITSHGAEWQMIINDKSFSETLRVKGECLKNVPRGYDPSHPQAEFLKNKSWYLEYPVSDEQLQKDSFINFAADIFIHMQPFNTFLNNALAGFAMPKR
jgi:TIGR02453 family protein